MPTYSYECEVCQERIHVNGSVRNVQPDSITCGCGGYAPRDYGSIQVRDEFWPHVTSNITGSPVEVTSPRQRDRLCEASGVVPVEPGMKAKKQKSKLRPFREDFEMIGQKMKNKDIDVSALAAEIGETV